MTKAGQYNTAPENSHHIAAFVGFPIPEDLYSEMEVLVTRFREGVKEHQGDLYAKVILGLVDESLDTFFLRPIDDIGMGSVGTTIVKGGVSSVKKAVGFLVHTLAKKLTNAEMAPLAEYLRGVIYHDNSKDCPSEHAYMASPINDTLNAELNSIVQDIEAGETGKSIEDRLVSALLEVSEISLDIFFAQPLKMLKLGLVMRKTAQMAFEGTRAAIRGIIKKVFKGMSERELRGVAQYIRSVRFARERFIE